MTGERPENAAIVVADLGGSNARFALSRTAGVIGEVETYPANRYANFPDALAAYLERLRAGGRLGRNERLLGLHIAAAGPVEHDGIRLTNSPWTIRRDEIARLCPQTPLALYNDLEAVALVLPHLGPQELVAIGATATSSDVAAPRLAVNVGTGFGAAVARTVPGQGWLAFASEAGHMTLAARNPAGLAVTQRVQSVEDVLSGRGLVALYRQFGGQDAACAADVIARSRIDTAADRALDFFGDLLGRTAGDLVLAHAAWGGVYLCGSVACGWARSGRTDGFRRSFEGKGLMSDRMARVATFQIVAAEPALTGLTQAAFKT